MDLGAEIMSWFTDIDNNTIMWMIISVFILGGTGFGLMYWDRFLHQVDLRKTQDK